MLQIYRYPVFIHSLFIYLRYKPISLNTGIETLDTKSVTHCMVNLVAVILINIYNVFSSHRPVDDLKIFARCPVLVNFLLLRSPVVSSIIPAKLGSSDDADTRDLMLNNADGIFEPLGIVTFLCILNKTALSQSLL
jgi:hypothetical protein